MEIKLTLTFVIGLLIIGTMNSCKKKSAEVEKNIDKELYDLSKSTKGFVFYKNSDSLLAKSSGTGHSQPFLKTRYNSIAATMLDSLGKIIPRSSFPEGSLIVKDLYIDSTTIGRYAILYKNAKNEHADAKGWVWGYVDANGEVAQPSSRKGQGCINCHSQGGSIDYMLMNKYFP